MRRNKTKKINVGGVQIGGQEKIVLQSMTFSKTSDINATLNQITKLKEVGCELIRIAVLDNKDVDSIKEIVNKSPTPVIADIHFNYKFAIKAINAGVAKIRINPGNISKLSQLREVVEAAKKNDVAIRIGINGGSLSFKSKGDKYLAKEMVKDSIKYIKLFESWNFNKIIVSLKHSNPTIAKRAYLLASKKIKYPLHLGVTEAGGIIDASIKTTYGLIDLLSKGIGDTLRVSITGELENEILVAKKIIKVAGLKNNFPEIISCPLCGRNMSDTKFILDELNKIINKINADIKISVMGCIVNGIGEAQKSDIGIISFNDKYKIYIDGRFKMTVEKKDILKVLNKEIDNIKTKKYTL